MASPLPPSTSRLPSQAEVRRSREEDEFYGTYKPMEGVMTAFVLGGFFVFVCILVLYKTQVKPMWKNRQGQSIGGSPEYRVV